jgi:hypothetical protein
MRRFNRMARGATQLGFLDVLTVAVLLAILLYVATLQFPVYQRPVTAPIAAGGAAKN